MGEHSLPRSCFSADVRMELRVNGHRLPIAQLGPDFLILRQPIDHPPADAEISMMIDGAEDCWSVRLHAGLSVAERQTSISPCPQPNGPTLG